MKEIHAFRCVCNGLNGRRPFRLRVATAVWGRAADGARHRAAWRIGEHGERVKPSAVKTSRFVVFAAARATRVGRVGRVDAAGRHMPPVGAHANYISRLPVSGLPSRLSCLPALCPRGSGIPSI